MSLGRSKNLYEEIGVYKNATTDDINQACNRLNAYLEQSDPLADDY
jgi:hypothetical protein